MITILKKTYSVWQVFVFACILLVMFPLIMIPNLFLDKKKGGAVAYFFLKVWAFLLNVFYFIRFKTHNIENIEKNRTAVFVANHNSFYDSVALSWAIPGQFRPLGKIEITKAPLFGKIYERVVVTVDRKSAESRRKSITRMLDTLREGISMLVYPEGRMNETKELMTEFHDGAFSVAVEAGVPIQPIILTNTRRVMPVLKYLLALPGKVDIYFLPAIAPQGNGKDAIIELKQKVRTAMENKLNELNYKH